MISLSPSEFIGSDQWKRYEKLIKKMIDDNRDAMEHIGPRQDPDTLAQLQGRNHGLRNLISEEFKDAFVGKKAIEDAPEEEE